MTLTLLPTQGDPKAVKAATVSAEEWDARAELNVGLLIRRYLAEHPAPDDARFPASFADWSEKLEQSGRARLEAIGARPLRTVGDEN